MTLSEIDERKLKGWSDGKKFIFEDLIFYGLVLVVGSCLDIFMNAYHLLFNPGLRHPYSFGVFQIALLIIGTIQLLRAWDRWKYYH